jgi:hypothetical protein
MTSTPQVDVEELKKQLRRELLGDLASTPNTIL